MVIHDYSLVYWEDVDASSSWLQVGATKSGTLHYKSHDAYFGFGGPVWKSAYFVLKYVQYNHCCVIVENFNLKSELLGI